MDGEDIWKEFWYLYIVIDEVSIYVCFWYEILKFRLFVVVYDDRY